MIEIKLTFSTVAEAAAALNQLNGQQLAHATPIAPAEKAAAAGPTEAPGKPSAAKTANSKRTAEAAPSPADPSAAAPATSSQPPAVVQPTAAPAAAPSAPAADRAAVSKAAVTLAMKDRARITEILAGFGAKGVKDVKDEDLAAVYAQVNAALGV